MCIVQLRTIVASRNHPEQIHDIHSIAPASHLEAVTKDCNNSGETRGEWPGSEDTLEGAKLLRPLFAQRGQIASVTAERVEHGTAAGGAEDKIGPRS